ncbi:transcription factor PIF3 isoform X1 [Cinnamomum micranthum f. kanehirae]|uniref:Transcription factor PIF3 isoform X1 n=1 Tax=Cinnamomum micranthum f. kanehirae TaxID=337451 RepID=A0A3S3PPK8_9MAGN|nr:transcription factor PIF3 isoform X1 [Cinnamomum micranthum f. kanehirae]
MPNPEVHQKAKEKIESTQKQMTNCSPSLAFMPDDEFVELLWENGEIVMKGQSNRAKKCSLSSFFSSDAPKVQEKDEGDAVIPKTGRYSNLSAVMNDFSPPELVQDDEMVPWLNDPVHDSLQSDYFAEFFTELTGTNLNSLSGQSNAIVTDSSNNSQVGIDGNVVSAHSSRIQEHRNPSEVVVGVSEPTRIGSIQSSSAKQGQTSVSNLRPRVSEFITNNNSINRESVPSNLIPSPVSATGVPNTVTQKNDLSSIRPQEPIENRVLMNFSHFLRPAGLVKPNMQGISTASASFSSADRLKRNEEVSVSGSNFIEPSPVVSTNGSEGFVGFQNLPASVSAKVDSNPCQEPPQELISVENSEATYQEDASRSNDDNNNNNNNSSRGDALHQSLSFAMSVAARRSESEKVLEPVLASSSMCSGNSAGGVSNDLRHAMKRKAGELEELEYQSEVCKFFFTLIHNSCSCDPNLVGTRL